MFFMDPLNHKRAIISTLLISVFSKMLYFIIIFLILWEQLCINFTDVYSHIFYSLHEAVIFFSEYIRVMHDVQPEDV